MKFTVRKNDDIDTIVSKINDILIIHNLEISKSTIHDNGYDDTIDYIISDQLENNKKKKIIDITEKDVLTLTQILSLPYVSYLTNKNGLWNSLNIDVQITLSSSINGDENVFLWIMKDGSLRVVNTSPKKSIKEYKSLDIDEFLSDNGYIFVH